MIVTDYREQYLMFENMQIWDITSMEDFFTSHKMMHQIFLKEYGFDYSQRDEPGKNFTDSDIMVVSKLLDFFGDKHFFVFSNNDKHHNDLKFLQDKKVINFGMDIYVLNPNRIYVLEMDKTKDLQKYDA